MSYFSPSLLRWLFGAFVGLLLFPAKMLAGSEPVITVQPLGQTNWLGSNAAFTVTATGPSLIYQWRFNGTNLANGPRISGAQTSTLTVSNLLAVDAGSYRVWITNAHGSVTSSAALLTLRLPPGISAIPNLKTFRGLATRVAAFTLTNATVANFAATASDATLVPPGNIILAGAGVARTVTVIPAAGLAGAATITLTVTNEFGLTGTTSFALTVGDFNEVSSVTNLPGYARGVANWADVDNDGRLDVLLSGVDRDGYVQKARLYRNTGEGMFAEISTPFPNLIHSSADWADYDADGFVDLAIKGNQDWSGSYPFAAVYHNDGGTNFSFATGLYGYYTGSLEWSDFDRDGRPDIIQGSGNLYHNQGDGSFSNMIVSAHAYIASADYNQDGWQDVMSIGGYSYGLLSRNLGMNQFTNSGTVFPVLSEAVLAWGEMNNDGFPELLLTGYGDTPDGAFTRLFRNTAGALTTNDSSGLPQVRSSMLAWGDVDNDGKNDLFMGGYNANGYLGKIFRNDGNEGFSDLVTNIPGIYSGSAAWGDYDNDGCLDLLLTGAVGLQSVTRLYHNDGAMPDTPPSVPGGLAVTRGFNSALFTWTASSDVEQAGGLTYNVRIGTGTNGVNVLSPLADLATGFRRVPKIGNAGSRLNLLITNLPAGNYFWSVQAVDNSFVGSPFAAEQSFTLPAPVITNQPQNLVLLAGSTATFTVGVTGDSPFSYQWMWNGTNLVGATNASLILPNVRGTNSGSYAVTVVNAFGALTSSNVTLTVNTPPILLAQPQAVTVIEGQPAAFTAQVEGDAPLVYQWFFNGNPVPDATNSTLAWSAVTPALAGNYFLLITNLSGTTNSVSVALNVPVSAPVITAQPRRQFVPPGLGVNANFSVGVVGSTPYFFQWRFNGADIPGANAAVFAVTNVQSGDAGSYSVLITNSVGQILSAAADLSVTPVAASTNVFIPFTGAVDFVYDDARDVLYLVNGGSDVQRYHLGSATFLSPISLSGSLMNLDISPDGNQLAVADHTSRAEAILDLVNLNTGVVQAAVLTNFPGYVYSLAFGSDGAVICEVGNLVLRRDPLTGVTAQRNSVTTASGPMTASGDRSTIGLAGNGSFVPLVFCYNVTNQGIDGYIRSQDTLISPPGMSRDGNLIAAHAGFGLQIFTNIHANDFRADYIYYLGIPSGFVFSPVQDLFFCGRGGSRDLPVYETAGFTEAFVLDFGTNITSARMRTSLDGTIIFGAVPGGINWLEWTNVAPSFISQPTNQTGIAGRNATFTTRVYGPPDVQYQWRRDGVGLPGATNATLVISNLPYPVAAAAYSVVAYNPAGFIVSTAGVLTVVSLPFVTSPPAGQTVGAGTNVDFSVTVDGTGPFGYQWRFNGVNLTGAKASSLTLTNVQAANAGDYTVLITNAYGSVTSSIAALAVVPMAPYFVAQPASLTLLDGSTATLSGQARGTDPINYQWQFNGTNLSGKTTTNLVLTGVSPANMGSYVLLASNSVDVTYSVAATLVVTAVPPALTFVTPGRSVPPGLPTTFSATVSGTPAPMLQWQLNGTNLPNATNASYTIAAVGTNHLGTYRLIASNYATTATSPDALLTLGNVAAWGRNASFESLPPPDLTNAFAVAGSFGASFAARTDGSLISWGTGTATNLPVGGSNVVGLAASVGLAVLRNDGLVIGTNFAVAVPVISNAVFVAAGNGFGQALRADGVPVAWGLNAIHTNLPAGLNHVTAIACGNNHLLAAKADGSVVAWGTGVATNVPFFATNVVSVAAGYSHSLALRANGTVSAWGSTVNTNLPPGLTNIASIFAGFVAQGQSVNMAVRSNGTVICWGENTGFGETNPPAALTNLLTVTGAAAANHTLAIVNDGRPLLIRPPVGQSAFIGRAVNFSALAVGAGPLAYQWLFNGTNLPAATNAVLNFSAVTATDAGTYQLVVSNSLGLATSLPVPLTILSNNAVSLTSAPGALTNLYQGGRTALGVAAAGNGPLRFQWFFSRTNNGFTPVAGATNDLLTLEPALAVQSGNYYVAVSNQVVGVTSPAVNVQILFARAWGFQALSNPAVNVTNAIAIATGGHLNYYGHYLALGSDGKVTGWPQNTQSGSETNVSALTNTIVLAIAAGAQHSLAVRSNGTVYAWGGNVANGWTNPPAGLSNVVAIASGEGHDLALKADGRVAGWGLATSGQTNPPASATNGVAIAAGSTHSLLVRADGTVVVWGNNSSGQTSVPPTATNVIAVAGGSQHSIALRANGTVVGWGSQFNDVINFPASLTNAVAIAAASTHSTVLRADGSVLCFGYEYIGTASNSVPGDLMHVASIAAGGDHDFGLLGTRAPAFTIQPVSRTVPTNTARVVLCGKVVGVQPMNYQWQFNGNAIAGATNDTLVFTNLQFSHAGSYQLLATNTYGSTASRAVRLNVTLPLAEAVDATNRVWLSVGNLAWFGQTNDTHDGTDAARSSSPGNFQESVLQTTNIANWSGRCSFWWKASSEPVADRLEFRVNGVMQTNISGEVDWQPVSIALPAGTNVLQWRYAKDGANSAGQDAAWVDQFAFLMDLPVILAQPAPANQVVPYGTNVSYAVSANGGTLVYQWQKDGTNLPGANSASLALNNVARAQNGTYQVIVTNLGGAVSSSNVLLQVLVPQSLSSPALAPDGSFIFSSADVGGGLLTPADLVNFEAQASTNLVDWISLPGALTLTNGLLQLRDADAITRPGRFYRILEN